MVSGRFSDAFQGVSIRLSTKGFRGFYGDPVESQDSLQSPQESFLIGSREPSAAFRRV